MSEMIEAFRIVKTKRAATAFDGEGARRAGGRWNSPGTRMVYLAESIALAALEILVQLDSTSLSAAYSFVPVAFPDSCLVTPGESETPPLPKKWLQTPAPIECALYGDQWCASQRSLVLRVPSVVVPWESNFLLNPAHPDWPKAEIGAPQSFSFDARLLKTLTQKKISE